MREGAYNTIFPPLSATRSNLRSLRLVAQDTALSRREQGFETPRERQFFEVAKSMQSTSVQQFWGIWRARFEAFISP